MVLAACGGEDGSDGARPDVGCQRATSLPVESVDGGIAVAARDDRFDPSCIELHEPGNVTLVVRNAGGHPHDLTLPGGEHVSVDAGQVGFLQVAIGPNGITFVCTIHPGMEGEIRVAST